MAKKATVQEFQQPPDTEIVRLEPPIGAPNRLAAGTQDEPAMRPARP